MPVLIDKARQRGESRQIQQLKKRIDENKGDLMAAFELVQAMWQEGYREDAVKRCRKLVTRKNLSDAVVEQAAVFLFDRRALHEAREVLLGLGDVGRVGALEVVEEDQVQVAPVAELAAGELAHADHQERSLLHGGRRLAAPRLLALRYDERLGEDHPLQNGDVVEILTSR